MSERLSPQGGDLLKLCDNAARAVTDAIENMTGTTVGGQNVLMGADGTPTKSIDRAAENAVLDTLRSSGLGFTVLSEEIGEVLIGEKPEPDYFLHLDPLDGTFNAIAGIPFYSVSIYLSRGDFHFGYISDLARGGCYYAEAGRGAYARPDVRLQVTSQADLAHFSISFSAVFSSFILSRPFLMFPFCVDCILSDTLCFVFDVPDHGVRFFHWLSRFFPISVTGAIR
jgi:myo-inositol-1(or 4)-monophosphatase